MKTGKTLQELAGEVKRQRAAIKDFRADTRKMRLSNRGGLFIGDNDEQALDINDLAHSQIAGRLNIPQKYYDLMRANASGLLSDNVNHWFVNKPETRLVRTLDGRVRAFLSSSYRPLDNFNLLETVLPKLQKLDAVIESSEITEKHLYIKAVFNHMHHSVSVGDVVKMGIVISNSEVGCGSLKVEPMIYRLVCKNGMIVADAGIRKYHVGRRSDEDNAQEHYREITRRTDDRAFWMKVSDVIDATVTQKAFSKIVQDLQRAKDKPLNDAGGPSAIEAVQEIANKYRMSDVEEKGVVDHLIKGGDLSTYGLVQAVTRTSQDIADYDRATEFERFGGEILAVNLN